VPFMQGALIADVLSIEAGKPHRVSLLALEDGSIFRAAAADFLSFLAGNPGFLIRTREKLVVE
jgi:hypothetical protein